MLALLSCCVIVVKQDLSNYKNEVLIRCCRLSGYHAITLRKHLAEGGQKLFSRSHISDQQVIVAERAGYHMKIQVFPSAPLPYYHC